MVREICTLSRLPYMEYVPRGGAFERPRIYCTSTNVHVHVLVHLSTVYIGILQCTCIHLYVHVHVSK